MPDDASVPASTPSTSPAPEYTEQPSAEMDILTRLNTELGPNWSADVGRDLFTGSTALYLSNACAVWVYPNLTSASTAANDFLLQSFSDKRFWVGLDPLTSQGIVLISDSEENICVVEVLNMMELSPL